MKHIKGILILLVFALGVHAQQKIEPSRQSPANPNIKNLMVGDKVPEILIRKIINYHKPNAKISDFKDRLLILDFWDTYCSSCIQVMPKLDSLQNKFKETVSILPVTYQKSTLVSNFFKTNKMVKDLNLPCVVEDDLLRSHFKHQLISHVVWIYKGIVKAITGTPYLTDANIQMILDGKNVRWQIKNDELHFDAKKPIFSLNDKDKYNNNDFLNYSGITGYRKGIDYTAGLSTDDDSVNHVYRTYFYNFSIVEAYQVLWFKIQPRMVVPSIRTVLEVKDPSKYIFDPRKGYKDVWASENTICFEMVNSKQMDLKSRSSLIVQELNNRLGLNGRWEKRKTKCLVLVQTDKNVKLAPGLKGATVGMDDIAFWLDISQKYPPTLDETGYTGKVVMTNDRSIPGLRSQLQAQGFDLIEAEREIEMLVISEINI